MGRFSGRILVDYDDDKLGTNVMVKFVNCIYLTLDVHPIERIIKLYLNTVWKAFTSVF